MCSPSSSQTVQNVVGFWITGKNDSTASAGLKFEQDGKFRYMLFDSVNFVDKKGTWEVSATHRIKIVIRTLTTKKHITYFRPLEEEYSFMLDKNKSAGFFDNRIFKKIDVDFSTKENDKSPQNVITKRKGIVI